MYRAKNAKKRKFWGRLSHDMYPYLVGMATLVDFIGAPQATFMGIPQAPSASRKSRVQGLAADFSSINQDMLVVTNAFEKK